MKNNGYAPQLVKPQLCGRNNEKQRKCDFKGWPRPIPLINGGRVLRGLHGLKGERKGAPTRHMQAVRTVLRSLRAQQPRACVVSICCQLTWRECGRLFSLQSR